MTESPIERPKHGQKRFYSGKKKHHTLKSQIIVDLNTGAIICTAHGQGKHHDFRLFKHSQVRFHPQTLGLADLGYQGITKLHPKSKTPKKKPKSCCGFPRYFTKAGFSEFLLEIFTEVYDSCCYRDSGSFAKNFHWESRS